MPRGRKKKASNVSRPLYTPKATLVLEKEEEVQVCNCIDYDGQDFLCKQHTTLTECPYCHCIKSERLQHALNATNNYACNVCGHSYSRNMENGDYFAP